MMTRMILDSGEIEWSDWVAWPSIPARAIPEGPGVYEVVQRTQPDGMRLQIGKAIHLSKHLPQSLLGDKRQTAVGGRIMAHEDVTQLLVRWAETDTPDAVKKELMSRHIRQFGRGPEYVEAIGV